MHFKVKKIPISSGNRKFVVFNKEDSEKYDIHRQSRIKLKHKKKEIVCIAETTYSKREVKRGEIGIYSDVNDIMNLKNGDIVYTVLEEKPKSIKFVKKKLSGQTLSKKEIYCIVKDIVKGEMTEVELTYFVAGCFSHDLSDKEITHLINALVETGNTLKIKKKQVVDKHCIGGIPNNRTTMIVVPIIIAFGLTMPKTSSRSITSPAGTADTMEVLCNVNLSLSEMKKTVLKTGGCLVWGGAMGLAPADEEIINVEYPLYIDTIGLLLSSVLAKKKAVGSTHVLIDIPYGEEAKVQTRARAIKLKKRFEFQGKKTGMKVKVVLTDGSQPIGKGVGPLLEVLDVLKVLRNDRDAPQDLKEKSISLAGELLNLSGKTKKGKAIAKNILETGKAYVKFMEIIEAQGRKEMPGIAKHKETMLAEKKGKVRKISNKSIAKIARLCGAPKTVEAGIYIHHKVGEKVEKNDPLITLYARSKTLLKYAIREYELLKPVKVN